MSIDINVNVGVTDEVVQLVKSVLQAMAVPTATAKPNDQQTADTTAKPTRQTRKSKTEDAASQAVAPENNGAENGQDTAKPETKPTDAPADGGEKPLTEEDVRAAMHKTRQRIEGENYKENTDSELYKKYHKALTTQFKQIAAFLGSDKPSLLPPEKRQSFIDECAKLDVLDDGTIGAAAPF